MSDRRTGVSSAGLSRDGQCLLIASMSRIRSNAAGSTGMEKSVVDGTDGGGP